RSAMDPYTFGSLMSVLRGHSRAGHVTCKPLERGAVVGLRPVSVGLDGILCGLSACPTLAPSPLLGDLERQVLLAVLALLGPGGDIHLLAVEGECALEVGLLAARLLVVVLEQHARQFVVVVHQNPIQS